MKLFEDNGLGVYKNSWTGELFISGNLLSRAVNIRTERIRWEHDHNPARGITGKLDNLRIETDSMLVNYLFNLETSLLSNFVCDENKRNPCFSLPPVYSFFKYRGMNDEMNA